MMNFDEAEKEGFVYYNKDFIFDSPRKYNLKYVFKYCIVSLLDYIYRFWLLLYRPEENEHKYEVSICAIFKNEAPFLKEWLDYHIMIGVDHFYLYNNNSEDNYSDVLSDYIKEGKVTLTEWPVVPGQIPSYKHWYENYRNETHWVSFLDLDEFICPRYNNNLKAWIGKYAKYPIVMIYWKMFGTSGKIEHDFNQLVTEQYTNSWPKLTDIGKLFYNTLYDISDFNLGMMHSMCVRLNGINIPPINIFGKFVRNGIHRTSNKEYDIQINHYWSKAYNSYKQKHERGDAAFGVSPRNFEYFLWHEQRNTSVDQNIFRFVIMLKLKKLIGGGKKYLVKIYNLLHIAFVFSSNTILRLFFIRKPKYKKKYKISICGIFKDEASFLREWIEYHELVGVEHFYLYNNNSTDNFSEVLEPYVNRGLVTLIDFPYDHAQIKAYKDFYEKYRHETQWVSFLDIDEFFVPTKANSLMEWMKGYERYPVILVYWKMFGTSGLMQHNWNKLVIEQYHVSWDKVYHCGKCLINTDYDITDFNSTTHHCPVVKYPILSIPFRVYPINQFRSSCIGESNSGIFKDESHPSIQINHYWSKAWDIYDSKRQKTDVYFEKNPKSELSYFLFHENENCSVDYSIYKFLMQLKLKMNNIQ